MKERIPREIVDQVINQLDILDVIGQVVQLKRSGRNYFGLCPFHSERTPSFSVSLDKQIFYCFGCGVGGDVVKFIMEYEQLSFPESIQHLATEAGVEIPQNVSKTDPDDERGLMVKALDMAMKIYHYLLLKTEHGRLAREYLAHRQVQTETIQEFQLGYAPKSPQFLYDYFTKRHGFSADLLKKAGLITFANDTKIQRAYDWLRNRIVFPIHDSQGRVIGFGGRSLDEGKPKYLNSPETPLFHKRNHLFNLHRARAHIRKQQHAIVFEGYMDVISTWQSGIHTGIATLGTSLAENQAKVIQRNVDSVILCYDSDRAGKAAANRSVQVLQAQNVGVKVAQMPNGMDPDDYLRQYGEKEFKENILAGAQSFVAFRLDSLKDEYNLHDEGDRFRYLEKAVAYVAELPRAIEREHYLKRLSDEFHISIDALKDELKKAKTEKKKDGTRIKPNVKWNNEYHQLNTPIQGHSLSEIAEMHLIAHMMQNSKVTEWVKEHVGSEFITEKYVALAAYLYAYYDEGNEESVTKFIQFLPDSTLSDKASQLAMMNLPDQVSEKALHDYVNRIKQDQIQRQIRSKEKQVEQMEIAGEPIKAAQLLLEIAQLRKQIQSG